jgi:hypothetical protein
MANALRDVALVMTCAFLVSCHESPVVPSGELLANGRWIGENVCLTVTDTGCTLVAGCGEGAFSRPIIRTNGTFEVDGTYRVQIGPMSLEPAPAHFTGSVAGSMLILTVVPSGSSPAATHSMTRAGPGTCVNPCV